MNTKASEVSNLASILDGIANSAPTIFTEYTKTYWIRRYQSYNQSNPHRESHWPYIPSILIKSLQTVSITSQQLSKCCCKHYMTKPIIIWPEKKLQHYPWQQTGTEISKNHFVSGIRLLSPTENPYSEHDYIWAIWHQNFASLNYSIQKNSSRTNPLLYTIVINESMTMA